MKYLIHNSDDFGMCHSVNTAVVRACREGMLTQASIMAPCPWFEEAAAMAREHDIPVGVHLVATCDWDRYRWRPLTAARSFVDADGVYSGSIEFVQKHADRDELEAEFSAQVELVLSRGIRPTHLDSHMAVMDAGVLAKVGRKYGLRTPHAHLGEVGTLHPDVVFPFASRTVCFSADADVRRKKADFCRWLEGLGDGYHLTAWHVGEEGPELESMASRGSSLWAWAYPYRTTDLAALCDPEIRRLTTDLGIELISLRDHPAFQRK
jgi:hypothetical protein